ncbi:MAG: phosphoglucomutase/phosphomannomutase family protein, partial [Terriglobia bacterium]
MPLKRIHFGTSGWRGIIADDFTFATVGAVVAGIADYVRRQNPGRATLLVGYDTRFHSEEFARVAAETLGARGVHTLLCERATPTPALACEILRRRSDGGINFTASHNPAEYNGLKFSTPDGAPALLGVTRELERLAEKHLNGRGSTMHAKGASRSQTIDPRPPYLEALAQKVDLTALAAARLKVAFDPLYGTGAGILDRFLQEHGLEV